jgi:hypothetical protein
MGRTAALILSGTILGTLTGCIVVPWEERARVIQRGMERCESMGKQFLLRNIEQTGVANVTREFRTTLEYACVGPGEKGYVPPA